MDAEVRETHSAVVVLVGDRVYKAKKPVRLPFLDFSTREARLAVAEREVELNRRLAPDVYLGVGQFLGPAGEPPEPVVVMRRMPEDRRLSSLVADGHATTDDIRAIARVVAAFHQRAERSPAIDVAGSPEVVTRKFETDIAETRDIGAGVLDDATLDDVGRLGRRYLAGRHPLLRARVAAGLIRDGHGDLLADDVFCLADGPRILDCIEFDDRLRHGDVLADIAFLAMDLERLDAPDLAVALLDAYAEFSGEHHPPSLAHYYIAARALIRAKVSAVRVHQGHQDAAALARRLLTLARDHLRRGRVRLVLVGGAPGSGKSTVAHALAPHLDAVVISSDEVRKDLAGLPHGTRVDAGFGAGIYDAAHTRATYDELVARARHLLAHGVSVVLDASWTRSGDRARARTAATETWSDLVELHCVAPVDLCAERVARRRADASSVSDATPSIAAALAAAADPWPTAVDVDTATSIETTLEVALAAAESPLSEARPDAPSVSPSRRRSPR